MGRYQAVDRDAVLDAAEGLIRTRGVAALTIDAVAKAAGISKGGVQSSFGTKDGLITAMYDRWQAEFDDEVKRLTAGDTSPMAQLRGHIEGTYGTDQAEADRAAGMMAALLDAPARWTALQAWYGSRLDGIPMDTELGRRARLAFLANEGLFMLRCFGFMKIDAQGWDDIYRDIRALLPDPAGKQS